MRLVDTHCHIQFTDYPLEPDEVRHAAVEAGVDTLVCVGCRVKDSKLAVDYASKHEGVWASVGIHPHEASDFVHDHKSLQQLHDLAGKHKVVAVGEAGLDYYYEYSPREQQIKLLRFQMDIAVERNLPMIFHVRDAFEDFWEVYDDYEGLRGVVHSFTADQKVLSQILERGLYVGLNGIMTFTKKAEQLAAAKAVPLDKLLLETDSPFLTPVPFRGKVCEPKYVRVTAEFLAGLRGESLEKLAAATTRNAKQLFGI